MRRKIVTVKDLIYSLQIEPLEMQKSRELTFLKTIYHDVTIFDAPMVGLYDGEQWSVFVLGFYDGRKFLNSFTSFNKYSTVATDAEGKIIRSNFVYPSAGLTFFEFPEELYGKESAKDVRYRKLSGLGETYKPRLRIAVCKKVDSVFYSFKRLFKKYYWRSMMKRLSQNTFYPEFVRNFFERQYVNLQSDSYDIELLSDRLNSESFIARKWYRFKLFFSVKFSHLRSRFKVSILRMVFPRLMFLKKYYFSRFNHVKNVIYSLVESDVDLKNVLHEKFNIMPSENFNNLKSIYASALYRYILIVGLDSKKLAECVQQFERDNFSKFLKFHASGITVEECLEMNIQNMPEEWVDGLLKK